MFITLTSVQKGEAVELQQPIDNRRGDLQIGLRSITYTVGWYNIHEANTITLTSGSDTKTAEVPAGLYNIDKIAELIPQGVLMSANRENGLIKLGVGAGQQLKLSDGLLSMLGLDDEFPGGRVLPGTYLGDRPVNFAATKSLHIHLDQLNTTTNVVDGAPSTLLTTVGLGRHAFGDTNTVHVARPEFKRLMGGTINELKIDVRDDSGKPINNHGLPISLTLEYEYLRPSPLLDE